jgi:hypothetical protein
VTALPVADEPVGSFFCYNSKVERAGEFESIGIKNA